LKSNDIEPNLYDQLGSSRRKTIWSHQ